MPAEQLCSPHEKCKILKSQVVKKPIQIEPWDLRLSAPASFKEHKT
jgi:hypothetical protein